MSLLCTEQVVLKDCDTLLLSVHQNHLTGNHLYPSSLMDQQHLHNHHRLQTACKDPTFLTDRCLENLLKAEEKHSGGGHCKNLISSYFSRQTDITPAMRKIVAEWMIQVCEENKCQEEVFLLALNYMDRFLATTIVRKTHLQILAAACLLLASKLREPSCLGLPAELLVFYTDNSITRTDLLHWELCVLSRLKWDISSVTPHDFLELLLIRLPIKNKKCPDVNTDKIRKHAQAFISLAAREHSFSVYSASTIAASSIAASLNGLHWHIRTGIQFIDLLNRLTDLTGVDQEFLSACMTEMEDVFKQQVMVPSYVINITAQNITHSGDMLDISEITTTTTTTKQAKTAMVTAATTTTAAATTTTPSVNASKSQQKIGTQTMQDIQQNVKL